jgi:hypothetical protein
VKRTILPLLCAIALLTGGPALGGAVAVARETQAPRPPQIEVLDAGSQPREALRLAPPVGTSQQSAMTMRLDLERSGVSDATIKAPPIRATIAMVLQDVTPDGSLHITFSYPSFDVLRRKGTSARERRTIERGLAALNGLSGEMTMTTQGTVVDSTLDTPPDLDPAVAQTLSQLENQLGVVTASFPQEEVVVGARWRTTSELTLNGIDVRQVGEFRLEKRNGPTLGLDVRVTQNARRQAVDATGGIELRIKNFKTTFRGSTTMDLTSLLPVSSRVRGSGDQTFAVRSGSESGELHQHIDLRVTLEPG